jgi:hypothetical protein
MRPVAPPASSSDVEIVPAKCGGSFADLVNGCLAKCTGTCHTAMVCLAFEYTI